MNSSEQKDDSGPSIVPDGDHDFALAKSAPSAWVRLGNVSVYLRQTHEGVIVETYRFGEEDVGSIGQIQHFFADATLEPGQHDAQALDLLRGSLEDSGLQGLELLPSDPRGANWGGAHIERRDQWPSVELAIDPEKEFQWRLSTNTEGDTVDIEYVGYRLTAEVKAAVTKRLLAVFKDLVPGGAK